MTKNVLIKLESDIDGRHFTSSYNAKQYLEDLYYNLEPGQAIEIKVGSNTHYIDYDEYYDKESSYETDRIMYHIKEYLG